MSINGADYTKRLAKDREYFADNTKKLRDVTEKRIQDTEARADSVIQKQRNSFIEDRADLEKSYQKNLENLKEKTQESLGSNASKFHEERSKERQNFTEESVQKRRDFDRRLNDIKTSYQKAFESETGRNENHNKTTKTRYLRNMDELNNKLVNKVKEYEEKITGTGAAIGEAGKREKHQLIVKQEERLADAYREMTDNMGDLKERVSYDNKKVKEAHRAEIHQQKDYTSERLKSADKKFVERSELMAKEYRDRNDILVEKQQETSTNSNREQQALISDIRTDYNQKFRKMELENRRKDNGSDEFADVRRRQQGIKDQTTTDRKVRNLQNEMIKAQNTYQKKAGEEQKNFNQIFREENIEAAARMDRKMNDASAEKLIAVTTEREKSEKEIKNRENQNNLSQSAYETLIMHERNSANDRIAKLKENFNDSMTKLEEKQNKNLEIVSRTSNAEKNDFAKTMYERRAEEMFEVKRAFGKMMDSTIHDYEQRLAKFQRENEYVKLSMDQKVKNIMEQAENQIESQRNLFEDRRSADIKSQRIIMDERESILRKNVSQMNLNFQKKIDKMQIQSDSKLKLITDEYESKLKDIRIQMSKELALKENSHQSELMRVKQTYEEDKLRVAGAYETKMDTLKNSHREQLSQVTDYKRLV